MHHPWWHYNPFVCVVNWLHAVVATQNLQPHHWLTSHLSGFIQFFHDERYLWARKNCENGRNCEIRNQKQEVYGYSNNIISSVKLLDLLYVQYNSATYTTTYALTDSQVTELCTYRVNRLREYSNLNRKANHNGCFQCIGMVCHTAMEICSATFVRATGNFS